ncbi:MAG: DUF2586 family protein [Tannerella sp.]|jgi:hypothetical protein|nr:DUF2586 family protein [Tannerella sp.]
MALNGLPKVTIDYGNGALGQTVSSADGLLCLAVCGATTVAATFSLAQEYSLRRMSDLEPLGVTEANNPLLYQTVKDFYAEAQEGTRVFIVGYPDTLKMSDVLNKDSPYLRSIIEATNGELRGLVVTSVPGANPTVTDGLDSDIPAALLNAQGLGEWARTVRYAPVFVILDGLNFSGNASDLKDLKLDSNYRAAVVIGSITAGAANQAVGLVAGRIASASVDRNIGRVSDGALNVLTMFAGSTPIEKADTETVYNKSYITFRTFTGVSGYFISDGLMATKETDDYNQLTAVRTIDKAARIAYAVLVQQLLDKVQVKSDGTMLQPVIVSWEQIIENALAANMTANGELSDDGGDNGVQVYINPEQDVMATGTIEVEIRVRPFGYARYIKVLLGFTVNN